MRKKLTKFRLPKNLPVKCIVQCHYYNYVSNYNIFIYYIVIYHICLLITNKIKLPKILITLLLLCNCLL